MADAAVNPQALAQQIYFLQNPQASLQFQRQQAIAQQLMDSGNQPDMAPNTLANPGGYVINQSPYAMLGKALEKGLGGYIQGQNNQKLAAAMQAGMGQQGSQPTGQPQTDANGNINSAPPVTGSIAGDATQMAINPEAYKAAVAAKYAGVNKGAEQDNTLVKMPDGTYMRGKDIGKATQPPTTPSTPPIQPTNIAPTIMPNGQPDNQDIKPNTQPIPANNIDTIVNSQKPLPI